MKQQQSLVFSFDHGGFSMADLMKHVHALDKRMRELQKITSYDAPESFIKVLSDTHLHELTQNAVKQIQALKPTALFVIGIGGSHLGTLAAYQAVAGPLYNQELRMPIYFADTTDPDFISALEYKMMLFLESGESVVLNIISKSGTTLETVANGTFFYALLKRYFPHDAHKYVVVTTDQDSVLWQWGVEIQAVCLPIPAGIGGRFSVFTPVGLFPLSLLGINTHELCDGALSMHALCMRDNDSNPAALSAAWLLLHMKAGRTIHDSFFFSLAFEGLGRWYRQLLAESIGKSHDIHGARINTGITPTVSLGSTDLHSIGQLYLAGPKSTITTFISCVQFNNDIIVPERPVLDPKHSLAGTSYTKIHQAILRGTQRTYAHKQIPFIALEFPTRTAVYVGQFMHYAMMQVVYLGYLLQINPFDQPEVELYKQETRKILTRA